jgi:hypothetical protein
MATTPQPKFPNLRGAFCAYYRCKPEEYQKRAFFAGISAFKKPFILPIYWFNKPFFAVDFGVIDSLGDARTETEYEYALDELMGVNRVERSIRRGLLGLRVSERLLMILWRRLAPYIEAPVDHTPPMRPEANLQAAFGGRMAETVASGPRELSPPTLRRLRVATEAIQSGVPVGQAATEAGFVSEAEFKEALSARAVSHDGSRWLLSQLQLGARVKELESDLADLKALLGEQQLQQARRQGASTHNDAAQ